tara:strand:- start:3901 stop:4218 length:318 start_codon:yes stop_codon:yes gene_type:complete
MLLKEGVSIAGCRAEILIAAITIICPVYNKYGHRAVVTSGTEKYKHSVDRSKHYCGDALDFRSRYFNENDKHKVKDELQKNLGRNFVVILEHTHFHIHYAPVYEA